MKAPAPRGLRVRDAVFALSGGAEALPACPVVRRLPGAPPGLRGIALLGQASAPVWALSAEPEAWIVLDHADGQIVVGGDGFAQPGIDAPPLAIPDLAPRPLPGGALGPRLTGDRTAGTQQPTPLPLTSVASYTLVHAGAAAVISIDMLEGILEVAGPRPARAPGMPTGGLTTVMLDGRPALLLDPGWCTGKGDGPQPTTLVAALRHAGRRFAMPVQQARPGWEGSDLAARLSWTNEGRALLAAAPLASGAFGSVHVGALQPLLVCAVGDARFALPVAEVSSVLAPRQPAPAPRDGAPALRGVVAHRGEVLPVIDPHPRLAAPMAHGMLAAAPMLRLALTRALAIPVQRILGLQLVATQAIAPVDGDPLISGRFDLDGSTLPLCRAATIAAPIGST